MTFMKHWPPLCIEPVLSVFYTCEPFDLVIPHGRLHGDPPVSRGRNGGRAMTSLCQAWYRLARPGLRPPPTPDPLLPARSLHLAVLLCTPQFSVTSPISCCLPVYSPRPFQPQTGRGTGNGGGAGSLLVQGHFLLFQWLTCDSGPQTLSPAPPVHGVDGEGGWPFTPSL